MENKTISDVINESLDVLINFIEDDSQDIVSRYRVYLFLKDIVRKGASKDE